MKVAFSVPWWYFCVFNASELKMATVDVGRDSFQGSKDCQDIKINNKSESLSFLEELSSLSPTILPWDRFSQWIHAICIVTFDLEVGQAMEVMEIVNWFSKLMYTIKIIFLSIPFANRVSYLISLVIFMDFHICTIISVLVLSSVGWKQQSNDFWYTVDSLWDISKWNKYPFLNRM